VLFFCSNLYGYTCGYTKLTDKNLVMQWSFPNTYFTCQPQIERKLLKAMCKSANTLYFEVILILYAINQIIFLTSVFFFSGESTNASVTLL